nr:unnamed protein product [Haemonchus contortus]
MKKHVMDCILSSVMKYLSDHACRNWTSQKKLPHLKPKRLVSMQLPPLETLAGSIRRYELLQKQLPLAQSLSAPSFFGENNKAEILQELLKYMCNEPEEDAVGVVTDFLYYLLRDGCLKTLVTTCLALQGRLYSSEEVCSAGDGWFFALNFIFESIDERCRAMYGAPLIRPALEKCQHF